MSESAPTPRRYMFDNLTDRDRLYLMFDVFHASFLRNVERALAHAKAAAAWRLLECACGEGLHAAELAQRFADARVLAFDRDAEAVRTAQKAFANLRNLSFHEHDAMDPLPPALRVDGGFDVAQMRFGLTHFTDPVRGLSHLRDALRPGGVLYLVDPRADVFDFDLPSMRVLGDAAIRSWAAFGTQAAGDRQVKLLEQAGFTIVESEVEEHVAGGPGSEHFPALLLMIETLRSMRRAIVEVAKVIDGAEFDAHLDRVRTEAEAEQRGTVRLQVTYARKP